MGLDLSDPEIERLIRQLSAITGEPLVEVVRTSLRERRERLRPVRTDWDQAAIDAIVARCAALPVLDSRSAEDILGYDENGLPT